LVGERDAQPVDLELAGVGHGARVGRAKRFVGAGEPLVQLGEVHGVIDGVHALGMAHLGELLRDVAADALGVAVRHHELGVGCLDVPQLAEVAIELRVAHLGGVERIVGEGRMGEDAVELGRAFGRGLALRRCRRLPALVEGVTEEGTLNVARLACHVHPFAPADFTSRRVPHPDGGDMVRETAHDHVRAPFPYPSEGQAFFRPR